MCAFHTQVFFLKRSLKNTHPSASSRRAPNSYSIGELIKDCTIVSPPFDFVCCFQYRIQKFYCLWITQKFALHACLFLTSSLLPAGDWALSDSCKSCSDVCLKGGHSRGLVVSLFCCKNSPNLSLYLKRVTCTFQRPSCKRQRREKKVTVTGKRKTPQVTRSVSLSLCLYLSLTPPLLSPLSFSLLPPSLNT